MLEIARHGGLWRGQGYASPTRICFVDQGRFAANGKSLRIYAGCLVVVKIIILAREIEKAELRIFLLEERD